MSKSFIGGSSKLTASPNERLALVILVASTLVISLLAGSSSPALAGSPYPPACWLCISLASLRSSQS